jgi:hypothetical protein
LLMSSRICQTTTLYRLILASDTPSKQKMRRDWRNSTVFRQFFVWRIEVNRKWKE